MSAAANTLWARCFVDELARHGVREVTLAPGSRSTPLVMAFARDGRFRLRVHLDERSAAFFALGVGKARRHPGVVLTTSGTAAANVYPAVVEASMSATPMLVLTADRPHRLRDADANQAIDQLHLYGRFVRSFHEMAPPTTHPRALRHLRSLAGRAVAAAIGPTAGPVHLNCPFDKPLEPVEGAGVDGFGEGPPDPGDEAAGREGGEPWVRVGTGRRMATEAELAALSALLAGPAGVIVAGPASEPDRSAPAALDLAARTGAPLLADPLSGARFGPCRGAHRVAAYDLLLDDAEAARRLRPSVVLRVGASPTSAAVERWLDLHADVPQVVIDGERRWLDHGARARRYLVADPADTLTALAARAGRSTSEAWTEAWRAAESAALEALRDGAGGPHEGDVLAAVASAAPAGATLFVSSSMPVRDLDAFAVPRDEPLRVLGNRGASGIDGIVSTAFGAAAQAERPTVCVLGDVALFHDQNGLLWSRESDAAVVFVLIDNDGGGIFHRLPIAEHEPHFTELFATPHGLDFAHAAALHGLEVRDVEASALTRALAEAVAEGATTILRVRSDRADNHGRHLEIRSRVATRVRDALAAGS